jgi:hypothetical protein
MTYYQKQQRKVNIVLDPRVYQDLIKGRFEINVIRIERTSNIDNDISNKLFDYSADTIKQLISDGSEDAKKILKQMEKVKIS